MKRDDSGAELLGGGGLRPERLIPTPCGKKSGRRPDIYYRDGAGKERGVNVGRTKANGDPVPREVDAMNDLTNKGNVPTTFKGYN